jgi:hypothetical protein
VTTTSGAVTITLPTISTVSDGFKIAIVKWTGDANAVTVARSSTNTINGATSVTIGAQYSSTIFVADFETNQWFAASSGLGTSNVAVDAFSGDNSTVAFTLSGDPGSENNTQVFVSGVYQEKDTYSVSGTTLTFSTAPPTGTSNIEVVSSSPLAIGTPSDGTVTTAKLASTTGSGAVVLATSPTLVTPTLGAASATSITVAAGAVGTPSITTTGDTNTGIFFPAADTIAFSEGGAESMRINSSGQVGVGATSSTWSTGKALEIGNTGSALWGGPNLTAVTAGYYYDGNDKYAVTGNYALQYQMNSGSGTYIWYSTAATGTAGNNATVVERMRITSGGNVLVGTTSSNVWNTTTPGIVLEPSAIQVARSGEVALLVNRITNDGQLVRFAQDGTEEGNISVSGTTVSYNGGHLARYAQTTTAKDNTLVKGTVLSNLDAMNVYTAPTTYWTEEDELPEGVNVGDVKVETHEVANEQLNKMKVSDVEGDTNVAGVFVNWTMTKIPSR